MKIVKARKKDFSGIQKMVESEFPYTKKTIEKIETRIKNKSLIFTAIKGKELLGFVEFKLNKEKAGFFGLVVKQEFRGKGIGRKLFSFFLDYCRKKQIKKISLIVKKDNLKAKNLYLSEGFFKVKELEKTIEDSTVEEMQLNLDEFKGIA
jgi:ribosomal protein S18 acetylase RimI-like enzyme